MVSFANNWGGQTSQKGVQAFGTDVSPSRGSEPAIQRRTAEALGKPKWKLTSHRKSELPVVPMKPGNGDLRGPGGGKGLT